MSQCVCAGDILGRAMKNLDGLLKMPYGCGEQNIALLAPNIYILQYLKNTKQLTPAIEEKATKFLTSGESLMVLYETFATFRYAKYTICKHPVLVTQKQKI